MAFKNDEFLRNKDVFPEEKISPTTLRKKSNKVSKEKELLGIHIGPGKLFLCREISVFVCLVMDGTSR